MRKFRFILGTCVAMGIAACGGNRGGDSGGDALHDQTSAETAANRPDEVCELAGGCAKKVKRPVTPVEKYSCIAKPPPGCKTVVPEECDTYFGYSSPESLSYYTEQEMKRENRSGEYDFDYDCESLENCALEDVAQVDIDYSGDSDEVVTMLSLAGSVDLHVAHLACRKAKEIEPSPLPLP